MTSYQRFVVIMTISCHFWVIQCWKISWSWNPGQRSLKVIASGAIQ